MQLCGFCGAEITRRRGFWNMWRAVESPFGDPEYCTASPNHAHKPGKSQG